MARQAGHDAGPVRGADLGAVFVEVHIPRIHATTARRIILPVSQVIVELALQGAPATILERVPLRSR